MTIWVNTLVKNEERYIWYAVKSVIEYVDKIIIWDTGSTDSTVAIINRLKADYPNKIMFKEIGEVDAGSFTSAHQKMLEETKSDWLLILDGDEVWWRSSIEKVVEIINTKPILESIVQPFINLIGDIYHFQDPAAGRYNIDGITGHLTIRAVNRKIPGLSFQKEHGQIGLYDKFGKLIHERPKRRRLYLDEPFLHFTNLPRSSDRKFDKRVPKRAFKYKYELGHELGRYFYYPEVLFERRPDIVPCPWSKRGNGYVLRSLIETPLKIVKRKARINMKTGY